MFFWLFFIIFLVSVSGIILLFVHHYTDVLLINPETIRKSDTEMRKEKILEERIQRFFHDRIAQITKLWRMVVLFVQPHFRILLNKIIDLQRKADEARARISRATLAKQEQIRTLIANGFRDIENQNYIAAEGKFIDAIRMNPRVAEAYKGLATVYRAKKAYREAEETLEFLLRLTPKDPLVYLDLIRLAEEQGERAKLLEYLARVIELEPNNPKHLDLLIETSILLGNKKLAMQGLRRLESVNPDNQKIKEFQQRIEVLH